MLSTIIQIDIPINISIQNLNIILPGVLLLLGFSLKLLIGRNLNIPETIQSLCELPVDIVFLALSFIVAFTMTSQRNQAVGLFYCFVCLLLSIIVLVLWRISLSLFLKPSWFWILALVINLFLSGFCIKRSVDLVIGKSAKKIVIEKNIKKTTTYNSNKK